MDQRDVHETGLGQGKAWGEVNMCLWLHQWVPNPKRMKTNSKAGASNKTRVEVWGWASWAVVAQPHSLPMTSQRVFGTHSLMEGYF